MNIIVGVDASRNRSGGAVAHLVGILTASDPTAYGIREVHVWAYRSLIDALPDRPWLVKHVPSVLQKSLLRQLWWQYWSLPRSAKKAGCNILLNTDAGSICPFRPAVTISQDMLSYASREMRRFGISYSRWRLLALRYVQSRSLRKAAGAIFLTQYAASAIQETTGILHRLAIIPHGVGDEFRLSSSGRTWPSASKARIRILYVSQTAPYKHQWNVVRAVARVRQTGHDVSLLLVGGGSGRAQSLLERSIVEVDPKQEFVEQRGFTSHDKIPGVLAEADLFVFASSCENMPITLLEAMASGLPIACSDRGPMPEVLGDAGVFFDPEDVGSIATAVRAILEDSVLRERIKMRAREAAAQYSWRRCSSQTWRFLRACASEAPQTPSLREPSPSASLPRELDDRQRVVARESAVKPRILVNATTMVVGGGIQVGASFVEYASNAQHVCCEFTFAVTEQIRDNLPTRLHSDPRIKVFRTSPARILGGRRSRALLKGIEKGFRPHIVYTMGLPSYTRFRSPEVGRYTNPWEINPAPLPWYALSWKDRLAGFLRARYRLLWASRACLFETQTEAAKRGIVNRLRIPADRVKVIPNSVNPAFVGSSEKATQPERDVVVFCLAAPYLHKNLGSIPDVALALRSVCPERDFSFVLTVPSGHHIARELAKKSERLGVAGMITNVGPLKVAECVSFYRKADIVFLPTLLEVFSATYLEAMAMCKPIVATDFEFSRAVCGDAAQYYDARSTRAAAQAIAALATDPGLRREAVERGRSQLRMFPGSDEKHQMLLAWLCEVACSFGLERDGQKGEGGGAR
jgi:glycosyltransferase involved in cell wall biosynthesis